MGAVSGKVTGRLVGAAGVRPGGRRVYDAYDLYATNGFNLPIVVESVTKWVEDKDGTLVQSPANTPAMPGMRLATTVAEGARLGPELVTNQTFDSDKGWVVTGESSIAGGVARVYSSSGEISSIYFVKLFTMGKRYFATYDVISNISGGLSESVSANVWPTAVGAQSREWVPVDTTLVFKRIGITDITIDNISVREVIPTWLPTNLDGTPICPVSRMIRTAQGNIAEYDETFGGFQVEPAATNACTCRKANPTDIAGLIGAGGGTVSVVDAPAGSLAASGLSDICTTGKVYKVTLSAVGGVTIDGTIANTNPLAISAHVMTEGAVTVKCRLGGTDGGTLAASTDKFIRMSTIVTPIGINQKLYIYSPNTSGSFYFILPELVEAGFVTSPIIGNPAADALATVTRLADNVTFTTPSWLLSHPNDFAVIGTVIPGAAGQATKHIVCNYTDANGECGIFVTATAVTFRKRAVGSNTDVSAIYTHAASVPMQYIAYSSAVLGMGISVRSYTESAWGDWTAWGTSDVARAKENAVLASTFSIGSQTASEGHFYGTFPMTRLLRIPTNLSAAGLQAWLIAKAGA